ncbi:hypothetical protein ACMD2_03749 [Ananas comosus]|uniref:Uncharacterized protein n=1 Tax=Ananas comosus TaxID=4615 RepID=A0A199V0F8_ANACO|nr:hypothetical protein ACMD2_03749 [Ananas comosus]
MSTPAITFSSPCRTAAGCALVPPITQNCSLRHHSCSVIPDHLISSNASKHSVTVMASRKIRKVMLKRNRREDAVDQKKDRRERIHADVEVSHPLQELHPSGREERVVPREEDLDRARGPAEHLMQPIVHRAPPAVVHPVPGDHVLGDRPVDPPDAAAPLGLVLVEARDHADGLCDGRGVQRLPRDRQRARGPAVADPRQVLEQPPLVLRHRYRCQQNCRAPESLRQKCGRRFDIPVFALDVADLRQHDFVDAVTLLPHRRLPREELDLLPTEPTAVLRGARRAKPVERGPTEHATGADIHRALQTVHGSHRDVEEHQVMVCVPIVRINPLEPLRELNIANPVAASVEHEAHALAESQGVDEGAVRHDRARPDERVHSSGLLVVIVPGPLLARDVDQHRQPYVHAGRVDEVVLVRFGADFGFGARGSKHCLLPLNDLHQVKAKSQAIAFTTLIGSDEGEAAKFPAICCCCCCCFCRARSSSCALYASDRLRIDSGSELIRTLNSSYSLFTLRLSRTKSSLTLFFRKSRFCPKYASGLRGSMSCLRQKGTQILAKLAVSAKASKSTARIERTVLAVTRGGSLSGSAVDTNTSTPGRSDRPLGLRALGDSNRSLSTARSAARFTGQSFGSWSRSHEKANHVSQAIDSPHSHTASRVPVGAENCLRDPDLPRERPPTLAAEIGRLFEPLKPRARAAAVPAVVFGPHCVPVAVRPLRLEQPPAVIEIRRALATAATAVGDLHRAHHRQLPRAPSAPQILHRRQRQRRRRLLLLDLLFVLCCKAPYNPGNVRRHRRTPQPAFARGVREGGGVAAPHLAELQRGGAAGAGRGGAVDDVAPGDAIEPPCEDRPRDVAPIWWGILGARRRVAVGGRGDVDGVADEFGGAHRRGISVNIGLGLGLGFRGGKVPPCTHRRGVGVEGAAGDRAREADAPPQSAAAAADADAAVGGGDGDGDRRSSRGRASPSHGVFAAKRSNFALQEAIFMACDWCSNVGKLKRKLEKKN